MISTLPIPFIKNPGFMCGQACSLMMIKYFYPDIEINFDEVNSLIHHTRKRAYTFPLENAFILNHYKVDTKCFSSQDYETTKGKPDIFKSWFGTDYQEERKYLDDQEYDWMVHEGHRLNLFEKRKTTIGDMIEWYKKGFLVTFALDWNVINHTSGAYKGHFVTISGILDDESILVHNPDERPFMEYKIELLEKAYNHPVIANDCWVAFGRKE